MKTRLEGPAEEVVSVDCGRHMAECWNQCDTVVIRVQSAELQRDRDCIVMKPLNRTVIQPFVPSLVLVFLSRERGD